MVSWGIAVRSGLGLRLGIVPVTSTASSSLSVSSSSSLSLSLWPHVAAPSVGEGLFQEKAASSNRSLRAGVGQGSGLA